MSVKKILNRVEEILVELYEATEGAPWGTNNTVQVVDVHEIFQQIKADGFILESLYLHHSTADADATHETNQTRFIVFDGLLPVYVCYFYELIGENRSEREYKGLIEEGFTNLIREVVKYSAFKSKEIEHGVQKAISFFQTSNHASDEVDDDRVYDLLESYIGSELIRDVLTPQERFALLCQARSEGLNDKRAGQHLNDLAGHAEAPSPFYCIHPVARPLYVSQLPEDEQRRIAERFSEGLKKEALSPEEVTQAVADAMDSKVSDLGEWNK
jgi:hypothetical protein